MTDAERETEIRHAIRTGGALMFDEARWLLLELDRVRAERDGLIRGGRELRDVFEATKDERDAALAQVKELRETIEAHWDMAPAVLNFTTDDKQRIYEAGWNAALADPLNSLDAATEPSGEKL